MPLFKKEYIPYKNYIYKVVVKGEKDELLLKIQELTFKMIDLNLYLDLNKDNTEIFNELKNTIIMLKGEENIYERLEDLLSSLYIEIINDNNFKVKKKKNK